MRVAESPAHSEIISITPKGRSQARLSNGVALSPKRALHHAYLQWVDATRRKDQSPGNPLENSESAVMVIWGNWVAWEWGGRLVQERDGWLKWSKPSEQNALQSTRISKWRPWTKANQSTCKQHLPISAQAEVQEERQHCWKQAHNNQNQKAKGKECRTKRTSKIAKQWQDRQLREQLPWMEEEKNPQLQHV